MPTYEYRCPEGHHFELFQKMSDGPLAMCPECGAESARQISGGAGFLFKGEGFYITETRSDSYKKDASKEKSDGVSEKVSAKKTATPSEAPSPTVKAKDPGSGSSGGGSSSEGS